MGQVSLKSRRTVLLCSYLLYCPLVLAMIMFLRHHFDLHFIDAHFYIVQFLY